MPKRKLEDNVAEQAMEGLVARVTRGVLEALAKQGVGGRSVPKFKQGEGKRSVHKTKRPDNDIRCWRCCKKGHKAREYKGEVTCYRCGGRGHIAQMCATPAPEEAGDLRDRLDEIRAREGAEGGDREMEGRAGRALSLPPPRRPRPLLRLSPQARLLSLLMLSVRLLPQERT
jgi:hypothetical protein